MTKDSDSSRAILQDIADHLKYIDLFAELLGYYISKAGISQAMLAQRIHVTEGTVSNWMAGNRLPESSGLVYRIGKALNLSPKEIDSLVKAYIAEHDAKDLVEYVSVVQACGSDEERASAISLVYGLLKIDKDQEQLPADFLPYIINKPCV